MGVFVDEGENHFRIEYRPPFGGIDTSVPSQFIAPNNLVSCNNALIRNGMYTPATLQQITFTGAGTYNGEPFLGFGELPFITSQPINYVSAGIFFCTAITSGANATVKVYQTSRITGSVPALIGTIVLPAAGPLGRMTYITINQVVYVTFPGFSGIIQLTPNPVTPNVFVATQLTAFIGGAYIGEMDGRLVIGNVWQLSGGNVLNFPYQFAWSADSEQYGIWNVLDVNSNPTGAGFNNLPDVEDVITGLMFNGPTAYIIRQQGVTEVTPLNSGIQPFNFNHMWASAKGIGSVFPNSICQYGPQAPFVSETDIFVFGLNGLDPIVGTARQAIYAAIYNTNTKNVFGCCSSLYVNGETELYYFLAVEQNSGSVTTVSLFCYSFMSKAWTIITMTGGALFHLVDARAVDNVVINGGVSFVAPVFAFQTTGNPPSFFQIQANSGSCTLVFPTELVRALQDITIDGILVYSPTNDGSTISPTIQGSDSPQVFDVIDTSTAEQIAPSYFRSFPPGDKPACTLRSPQLTLGITNNAQIGHVIIWGTTTSGRPF